VTWNVARKNETSRVQSTNQTLESDGDDDDDSTDDDVSSESSRNVRQSFTQFRFPAASVSDSESESDSGDEEDTSSVQSEWDVLLPVPEYGSVTKVANFPSVEKLMTFIQDLEPIVQKQLEEHNYDAVGGFIKFYQAYQKCRDVPFETFFRAYDGPITPEHYTCVGLSMDLLNKIQSVLRLAYPGIVSKFFIASCEEQYDGALSDYSNFSPPPSYFVLKEHVMLVLKISVNGRTGRIILDPGYHVSRAVVVMEDRKFPHTDWFVQSDTPKMKKEYGYEMLNDKYVLWHERNTKGSVKTEITSLVYVHHKFENYVDYTERRNLVYNFRVLVKRNRMGDLLSGFYFPLKAQSSVTLFYQDKQSGKREECRIPFHYFEASNSLKDNNDLIERSIVACGENLKIQNFRQVLVQVADIVSDQEFLTKVLDINTLILEDD